MLQPANDRVHNNAGRVPEWTKGADCKSAIRGFESHRGLLNLRFLFDA